MKKVDHIYRKGKYLLIGGIICFIGSFNSCSLDGNDFGPVDSSTYGRDVAVFKVKGTVIDNNAQPLENILVEIPNDINDSMPYQNTEKRYTDKNGNFEWSRNAVPKDYIFRFIFKDIDGKNNGGEFKNDTIDIKFSLKQLSESGGNGIWSSGSVTQSFNKRLNKKE